MLNAVKSDTGVMEQSNSATAAVLFSGGRDSTLSAVLLKREGVYLHLLSCESGLGYAAELREFRLNELEQLWGRESFVVKTLRTHGLVRQICFVDLAEDVREDGCQLILLGEFLAMVASALAYCKRYRINRLAYGATRYQSHFPEQQPATIRMIRELCDTEGVHLLTPVINMASELDVRLALLEAGLSGKSLEGSTLLADIDDSPAMQAVVAYVERKLPYLRTYLAKPQF